MAGGCAIFIGRFDTESISALQRWPLTMSALEAKLDIGAAARDFRI
jgi:hypothetical protein